MKFMNDYDLYDARQRFGRGNTPNRLALVMVIDQLRMWVNNNSDGWAYWQVPLRAAQAAIGLIESTTNSENEYKAKNDITEQMMEDAVKPIRRFLRRANITPTDRELVLRAVGS